MAKVEEVAIKIKLVYNDDKTHRYSLTKTWDSKKSKALVVMKNPSSSEVLETDLTTMLVINNLAKLDYGTVCLCNLLSKINAPHIVDGSTKEHTENVEEIKKLAKTVDYIIIGWGTYGEGNKKVTDIQEQLIEELKPYKDKLMYIVNPRFPSKKVHPLCPSVRSNWLLKPYFDIH